MFEARLEAKTWKKIINAISAIVEEAPLQVTPEGIKFTAMDPSHISMIDFFLRKENFLEYRLDEKVTIGIDVEEMKKIINRSKPADEMTMETHGNKLSLTFQSREGEAVRKFSLSLIDIMGMESFKVPSLQTTASIKLSALAFDDGIKDAQVVADHITFVAREGEFIMKAEGDSGGIESTVKELISIEVSSPTEATFNLSYLTDISRAIEEIVALHLGTNMPLKLEFTLDGSEMTFVLAPRVERE